MGKDDILDELVSLHIEKEAMQIEVDRLEQIAQQLRSNYEESKRCDFMERYRRLKEMVKEANRGYKELQNELVRVAGREAAVPTGGLLANCRALAQTERDAHNRFEIRRQYEETCRSKAGLRQRLERMRVENDAMQTKLTTIKYHQDDMLKRFEAAKHNLPNQRYTEMKVLIKRLIREPTENS